MHAHRRFLEARNHAGLPGCAVAEVTKHEHCALAAIQSIDRGGQARPVFAREETGFRVWRRVAGESGANLCGSCCLVGRNEPAAATAARLAPVQAAVDENPCEPDLERPRLAIRGDMGKDLDERVLNRLVSIGAVAQILIRDAERPALMADDEFTKTLA